MMQRLRRVSALTSMALALTACGAAQVQNECPETKNIPCAGNKICEWDDSNACRMCQCEPPDMYRRNPDPSGGIDAVINDPSQH